MNFKLLNNKILIVEDTIKINVIKKISQMSNLLNIKILTLSEFKKNIYFDYDYKTIHYIKKKYKINVELAKIYIENMYYVDKIIDKKTDFLFNLKLDLEKQKLLYKNEFFLDYIENKTIVIYNLNEEDKFIKKMLSKFSDKTKVEFITEKNKNGIAKELYAAESINEEIEFVANKICELLKKNININKIKLANVRENYYFLLTRTFKLFNIPIELTNKENIKGTKLISLFKENFCNDISKVLHILEKNIKNTRDEELYNKIVMCINEYAWCDNLNEIKEELINNIENISVEDIHYSNSIKTIDIMKDIIEEDEYIFLLNYNQNAIPIISKDEEFLTDNLKEKLDVNTSYDNNFYNNKRIQTIIKNAKNLIVTYSKHDLVNELYISSSYEEKLFVKKDIIKDFNNSDNYNLIKLTAYNDQYRKFGTNSIEFQKLKRYYNNFKYLEYDNKFKSIDLKIFNNHIKNIHLSYTSLNSYYECGFKYYLSYILKVDDIIQNFQSVVGTLFHKILSESFKENFDFNKCWEDNIKENNYVFNNMEIFFLDKLKEELKMVIEIIKNQMNETTLKKALFEKKIIIKLDEKSEFIGIIDKILYNDDNGQKILGILDYKTGNVELNLNNIFYGLNLQLPIYIYLIKNSNEFKNSIIGGFYLQKIISNSHKLEDKLDDLKWKGYSNSDENILNKIDVNYQNSKLIKNMKLSNNGFYQYAKVISNDGIENLYNIVSKKIVEAKEKIWNLEFSINPKQIKENNVSCKFCKYRDICYMDNKDIIKLKNIDFDENLNIRGE